MQFKILVRFRFIMTGVVLMLGCLISSAASIQAQASSSVFDSPWRGFNTGAFGNGFAPASFAVGDLDGDGDSDALVGDSFAGSFENGGTGISVLKNNGDKTFAAPVYYPLAQGQTVGEVSLSDFDADGDLDAFATIRGNFDQMTKIRVWRNNGDGTFAPSVEFATGQGPAALVVADFTGDGKPDVMTANYGGASVSLLKHNGQAGAAAGFLDPVSFSVGVSAEKIAAADVNGDGKTDVAVGGPVGFTGTVSISVLLNNGAGNLAAPVSYDPAPGARLISHAVALADLDNDGDADLIAGGNYSVGSSDYGALTIRRNNGSGVFGNAEVYQFDIYIPQPKEITTGDLNHDGFADVIAAVPSGRSTEGYVTLLSNGAGGFSAPVYYEASQQTFDVAAVDIDRDGDSDVLTLANSSAAITVHENPGNGTFRVPQRFPVASLSDAVESADIDNDGDVDIVVNGEVNIASNDAVVKILKNNGDGTFEPAISYSPPRNFADMKLRDINGDGFVDLIFAPDGNYPSYHIGTALNNGDGTFAPVVVRQLFACGEGTIDAFDLDGDGDRDIVLTEEESCQGGAGVRIFILRNDGNQNFFQMPVINAPGLPHGLSIADVNNDGKADIVTALSQGMGVFPGNGNLTFGAPVISTTRPYKFRLADFNRDGKLDVGMIMQQDAFGTDTIATALGNGDGSFQAIRTQTGSSVLENLRISDDLEVADFDRDGNIDLLTFNYASNDVSLFLNDGSGALRPHQRYGIGNTPNLGTAADFNGDGKTDIAVAIGLPPSGLQNAIVVLRNTAVGARKTAFDFDGDGKTDVSVFRQGSWYLQESRDGFKAVTFGLASDKLVPADYDGDGKTDVAVFRSSNGTWYITQSSDGAFRSQPFGASGDLPIAGDFDGDGKSDLAVFRPSSGVWYISQSSNGGVRAEPFGAAGDVPLAGDFDGDGRSDLAVFRGGTWYIQQSAAGFRAETFGINADKAVPADYDGDGKTDLAVFRTDGNWYVLRSSNNGFSAQAWGLGSDVATAGDYDGDGKADFAVFRPSNGAWYILQSSDTALRSEQFGQNGDVAIPSSFVN
ncbi:MAG TPA: VCBS repeat-containing protein [Pyrinomonadaceae bacterium]